MRRLFGGLDATAGVHGSIAAGLDRSLALPHTRRSPRGHRARGLLPRRTFDHYFGSYRGVRGFADPNVLRLTDGSGLPVFAQPGYPAGESGGHLYPFRLNAAGNGESVDDITHERQYRSWNDGRMDGFVREHLANEGQNWAEYPRLPLPARHPGATAAPRWPVTPGTNYQVVVGSGSVTGCGGLPRPRPTARSPRAPLPT